MRDVAHASLDIRPELRLDLLAVSPRAIRPRMSSPSAPSSGLAFFDGEAETSWSTSCSCSRSLRLPLRGRRPASGEACPRTPRRSGRSPALPRPAPCAPRGSPPSTPRPASGRRVPACARPCRSGPSGPSRLPATASRPRLPEGLVDLRLRPHDHGTDGRQRALHRRRAQLDEPRLACLQVFEPPGRVRGQRGARALLGQRLLDARSPSAARRSGRASRSRRWPPRRPSSCPSARRSGAGASPRFRPAGPSPRSGPGSRRPSGSSPPPAPPCARLRSSSAPPRRVPAILSQFW